MGFILSSSKSERDAGWLVPKVASPSFTSKSDEVNYIYTTEKSRPSITFSRINLNKNSALIESSNSTKNPEARKMESHTYSTRQGSLKTRETNGV